MINFGMRWPWGQKAATSLRTMVFSGARAAVSLFDGFWPDTNIAWRKTLDRDYRTSSVLAAPLNWLMRTFPEAPIVLERRKGSQWEIDVESDVIALLERPNDFYSDDIMWMAVVLDLAYGNAYLMKIRNAMGEVIQLWWMPRLTMTPMYPPDGTVFISHYAYRAGPGVEPHDIPVNDVLHFRFGLDPENPRLGLSQLGSLIKEVTTDEFAAEFTAAILKNLGIIGVILSPEITGKSDAFRAASQESLKEVKEYMKQAFTGEKRGEPLALRAPTKAQLLQYNMQGFDVGPIRDISEERVCAAIGVPAAVVGFGTGLQQTKVGATMKEMRQLAWIGGVMPLQRIVVKELMRSLLPDFGIKSGARLKFSTEDLRSLWETPSERADRIRKDFTAGGIMRSEFRRETGRTATAADDVYLVRTNVATDPTTDTTNTPVVDPEE